MSVKEDNEITIKVTCSNTELIKHLINKGFTFPNGIPKNHLYSKLTFIFSHVFLIDFIPSIV